MAALGSPGQSIVTNFVKTVHGTIPKPLHSMVAHLDVVPLLLVPTPLPTVSKETTSTAEKRSLTKQGWCLVAPVASQKEQKIVLQYNVK